MEAQEEWRRVDYAPGYEVSNLGRVRSWHGQGRLAWRADPRLRKIQLDQDGYHRVDLMIDGKRVNEHVSHMVAHAFHGPRPEGLEIRHLDGNSQNDVPSNLKYGTHSENMYDRVRHGNHPMTWVTHCPRNHPYDDLNTRRYRGWRKCRACQDIVNKRTLEQQKVARAEANASRSYYYPREVAAMFNVTVTSIANWAKAGKLPVYSTTPQGQRRYAKADVHALLGGHVRVPRAELDAIVEARTQGVAS